MWCFVFWDQLSSHATHTYTLSWHPTNKVADVHLHVPGVAGPILACCPDFMPYSPSLFGVYCLTRQQFPQIGNVWWLSAGPHLPLSSSPHINMERCRWTHPRLSARTKPLLNLDEPLSLGMIWLGTYSRDIAGPKLKCHTGIRYGPNAMQTLNVRHYACPRIHFSHVQSGRKSNLWVWIVDKWQMMWG